MPAKQLVRSAPGSRSRRTSSPPPSPAARSERRLTALAAAIVVSAGLLAFGNSFQGVLVFDERQAISDNLNMRHLWPLGTSTAAPEQSTLSGRPVAAFTFALNYALAPAAVRDALMPPPQAPEGTDERVLRNLWGYHAVNLAIHVLAALVLFGILRRTLLTAPLRARFGEASLPLAAVIAIAWTVHPLQTGSVTYIVQRVESLMGLFYLLTLYCALRAATSRHPRLWWVASILACGLGMGTKEVMVTAPVIVVLYDFVFLRTPEQRPGPIQKDRAAHRAMGGSNRASRSAPNASGPTVSGPADTPQATGDAAIACRRWPLYLGLAATWVILAALVAQGPRTRSVGFGFPGWPAWTYFQTQLGVVACYLRLAVVPSPLVLDYEWGASRSLADVALPGLVLAALGSLTVVALLRRIAAGFAGAWFFVILAPTSSVIPIITEVAAEHRMYLPLAAVAAVVVLGAFAAGRRLFETLVADARARSRLSWAAAGVAVIAVALPLALAARARNDDYRSEEALWADTVAKRPTNARARTNYAAILLPQGRAEEAVSHLREAVRLQPSYAEAHLNLGVGLCTMGRLEEGIEHLEQALRLVPGDEDASRNLGEAYASLGRNAEAVRAFRQALERSPNDLRVINNLGWILATAPQDAARDGTLALGLAERAVSLTNGSDVVSLDTLAAAYAETGRLREAVSAAERALALALRKGERHIVAELQDRLALYRSGGRFRQPLPR